MLLNLYYIRFSIVKWCCFEKTSEKSSFRLIIYSMQNFVVIDNHNYGGRSLSMSLSKWVAIRGGFSSSSLRCSWNIQLLMHTNCVSIAIFYSNPVPLALITAKQMRTTWEIPILFSYLPDTNFTKNHGRYFIWGAKQRVADDPSLFIRGKKKTSIIKICSINNFLRIRPSMCLEREIHGNTINDKIF